MPAVTLQLAEVQDAVRKDFFEELEAAGADVDRPDDFATVTLNSVADCESLSSLLVPVLPPLIITDAQDGLDEGNYVLGIRERSEEGSRGLIFIEGVPDGDEEMEGEMNSYCLAVDPGQAEFYGGVERCEIYPGDSPAQAGVLLLTLEPQAARVLELPQSARFDLFLPARKLDVLRRGLRRILGSGCSTAMPDLLGL